MNVLAKLQEWFASQCDGDWEHGEGIRLASLDNPGWALDIALAGTGLEDQSFNDYRVENSEQDWLQCFVVDNVFKVRCGPLNLQQGVSIFLEWADSKG